jgi:hypothetical protein
MRANLVTGQKFQHGSIKYSYGELYSQSVSRLRILLFSTDFNASSLDLLHFQKIGRGRYFDDLELLIGDKLSSIQGLPKSKLQKLYFEKMKPAVIEIYEDVLEKRRKTFPNGFWNGWQGKLNFIICFTYLLEEKFKIKMNRSTRQIDQRLLRKNQSEFLRGACGKEDWVDFMSQHKLAGGFYSTFGNSTILLMRNCFPWAFNMNTPEGEHLHLDEFRQNNLWVGEKAEKIARRVADHKIRKHLGLIFDPSTHTFDQRLLRENQTAFLASKEHTCWRDLFNEEGLGGLLASRKDLGDKIGNVFKWLYPWAFDWDKPEGEHLHPYDFEAKDAFASDKDLREAVLHEIKNEGWELKDLPQKINEKWLIEHGLESVAYIAKLELFRRAFASEFESGLFSEADFHNQGTMRKLKVTAFRKIQRQKARNTTYGIIHIEKKVYYFPEIMIGNYARKESSEHGVIYAVKKETREEETIKIPYPIKAFKIAAASTSFYARPELIDYDKENFPILPKDIKTSLINFGIAPHNLTISEQKSILRFVEENGTETLFQFLTERGYFTKRRV